jgi:tRNA(Ile)-lysidine synthase
VSRNAKKTGDDKKSAALFASSAAKTSRSAAASASALTYALIHSIKQSGLLREGDRLGVAVSGGADSVALLLLLVELRAELGLTLRVLHFNHKLRGRAAELDEKFVARLAERCGLAFHAGRGDVRGAAAQAHANLEDAARRARYAFLQRCADERNLPKIAVAHTADDQAETVLAHILRGSGLAGLGGVHPQNGCIVRPLLGVARGDLRAYLKARKQPWREDATNRDATKTRARIRKTLLPLLQKKFQPRVVEHLASLAAHAREDDAVLNQLADEYLAIHLEDLPGGVRMRVADLVANGLAQRLIRRMVREVKNRTVAAPASNFKAGMPLQKLRASSGELTALHVRQVLDLARHGNSGASLQLAGGMVVRRHWDALTICVPAGAEKAAAEFAYKIEALKNETRVTVPELGCAFRFSVIDWLRKRGETSIYGEVLNGARLSYPLVLRSWRHGDRFCAQGHSKPQKLKRLLNEKRIDRWQRQGWPVLESQGELAWSRVFGAAAGFAATDQTQTGILIVEEKSV